MNTPSSIENHIYGITRPDSSLLNYYIIKSLTGLIFAPIMLVTLYFKYHTLRYRFDNEGISMSWGLLFRREINLTYRRIQDIHVSRGLIERWFGLATLSIQTASGSAGAEMAIQGIKEYEQLRDFLYSRMRGHRSDIQTQSEMQDRSGQDGVAENSHNEALELLRGIHTDMQAVRTALEDKK
jgi:uncharacterized protein